MAVRVGCTSQGIQISAGTVKNEQKEYVDKYTLTRQQGIPSEEVAKTVATLIRHMRHYKGEVASSG